MQPNNNEDQKQQLFTQKNSTRNYLNMMKNRNNIALSKIIVRKIAAMPEQNNNEKSEQKDKDIDTNVQNRFQDPLVKIDENENKDNIDTSQQQHQDQDKVQQNYMEQIPLKYAQNYKIIYNKIIKKYRDIDEQDDISKYQSNNTYMMQENEKNNRKPHKNNIDIDIDRSNKYIINTILTNYHRTNSIFSTQKLLNKVTSNPQKDNQIDKNIRTKKGDKNSNLIKKIANKEKKNKKDNPQITPVSMDYITKLQGYKANIYKLIPISYITQAKDTQNIAKQIKQFCGRFISGQYERQIMNQSCRFNKVYQQELSSQQDKKLINIDKLKIVQNYEKYKVLAKKYINKQVQNINSNMKLSQNNEENPNSMTKQLIKIFTKNIEIDHTKKSSNSNSNETISLGLCQSNRRLNKKYKKSNEIINQLFNNKVTNILQCKYLEFVANVQTKIKLEVPETNFLQCLYKQVRNNCNQQNSSSLSDLKQNTYKQFRNNFTQYFINGPPQHKNEQNMQIWPLFLKEQQLLSYNQLMEGLKNKFQVQYQQIKAQNSRNLVTGNMVYQVQDKIAEVKYKQAFWIRYCSNLIKNKNENRNKFNRASRIQKTNLRSFEQQKEKVRNRQILNKNIEIMKKIKKPQQKSINQANPNSNLINIHNNNQPYPNYRKSIYQNLYDSNSNNHVNVNTFQINRLDNDNFYGNLIKKSKNNRKSLFQQKKSELQKYINHLSHQQNKKLSQPPKLNSRTNQVIIQPTPYKNPKNKNLHIPIHHHNKYIKYNRYPIKFKQNLYFYSQNIHHCAIVYELKLINLKELTLRFITDRRKYMVNTVKIIVHPQQKNIYHEKDTDTNKLLRAMQILNCLGANVTVQQQKPYQILESQQNITVELLAFILGQNVQKIYQIYNKFHDNY